MVSRADAHRKAISVHIILRIDYEIIQARRKDNLLLVYFNGVNESLPDRLYNVACTGAEKSWIILDNDREDLEDFDSHAQFIRLGRPKWMDDLGLGFRMLDKQDCRRDQYQAKNSCASGRE